jgi:UDP-2,3-diacylglucosamine hydrolase
LTTLLLSDLHLPPEPSPLREGFAHFLSGPARAARRVYILGDLFEYWVGDDAGVVDYAEEVRALAALVRYGVPVYFQHGNRDFLVGRVFCAATGVRLLSDPAVVDLEGRPTLLSHGDLFCTDDVGYQRWRRFARNPVAQWLFRHLPESRRRRIVGGIRGRSDAGKRNKPESIMDVNPASVASALRRHGVRQLIHGHTHRPGDHRVELNGETCERHVLADWRPERMEYLKVSPSCFERITL